jgi:hypothetical protein
VIGAFGDYCDGGCPLLLARLDLGPLLLVEPKDLELVLLEAAVLVAVETVHHSATD